MLFDTSERAIEDYLRAGRSAVDNIEHALSEASRDFASVRSLLDFGCGHGRVLRQLRPRIPQARVTACDVDAGGVKFCAAEFGAEGIVSSWKIERIRLGSYDLIWSGSVFTHLDAYGGDRLLTKLAAALEPGGVLVFSVHGDFSLDGLEHLYGAIYAEEAEEIRRQVAEEGIAFRPYDASFGSFAGTYGMTWHDRVYLEERARVLSGGELEPLAFTPHGWDHHHDVIAFRRRTEPPLAS